MREAVVAAFPDTCRVNHPRGGFVLWGEMPGWFDSEAFTRAAMAEKISLVPGTIFSPSCGLSNFFHLSCGFAFSPRTMQAVETLGAIARKMPMTSTMDERIHFRVFFRLPFSFGQDCSDDRIAEETESTNWNGSSVIVHSRRSARLCWLMSYFLLAAIEFCKHRDTYTPILEIIGMLTRNESNRWCGTSTITRFARNATTRQLLKIIHYWHSGFQKPLMQKEPFGPLSV